MRRRCRSLHLSAVLALGSGLTLGLLWLAAAASAQGAAPLAPEAALVYVRTDGHDANCNGEYDAPATSAPDCAFATIQRGVDSVDAGGVVVVAAGTYVENITITQSLALQGAGASSTLVDGGDAGRVFAVANFLTVEISDVTIQHGRVATGDSGGAGIRNWGSTLTLADAIVRNNTVEGIDNLDAGGAIHNLGVLRLENVTISGNSASRGGGIRSNNVLTITSSAFISNTVSIAGGGILNYGTATLENVTFSGNAAGNGAAIRNDEDAALNHCTIAGDIYNTSALTLVNTILTDTCSGPADPTSAGHNLERADTCGLNATTDMTNTDPLLAPLTYDRGTWVHPLLADSPAIDAGTCLPGITTDQRGVARPVDGDGDGTPTCDIGAYERERTVYLPLILRDT